MVLKILYIYKKFKNLDLFSVEERLLIADVIKCWKIFHSKCGICTEDIFVLARSGITHGLRFKIVSLFCRRRLFSVRVAYTWTSLPNDVVALDSLGSFKRTILCCLNKKLFHFVQLALCMYFVLLFTRLLYCYFVGFRVFCYFCLF